MDQSIVSEPVGPADSAVIWLHGLGASGDDFAPVVPMFRAAGLTQTRFIFPHAPVQPVTVNGGMAMPAWYDIVAMDLARKIDVAGIRRSATRVDQIIAAQIADGIESTRIVLVGFSQGGAVALYAGVRSAVPLAGILALSTYWVGEQDTSLQPGVPPAELPIAIHHGTQDPVVPFVLGEAAKESLEALGYATEFQAFAMPHSVVPEQLADIGQWMTKRLHDNSR